MKCITNSTLLVVVSHTDGVFLGVRYVLFFFKMQHALGVAFFRYFLAIRHIWHCVVCLNHSISLLLKVNVVALQQVGRGNTTTLCHLPECGDSDRCPSQSLHVALV